MKNIFYRRDGQVAPFMIAIIVVLIMALMVTVNIGKVGFTKTNTANAADAGALAGSVMHANTLNSLADTNTAMIAEYLSTQAIFLVPAPICTEWVKFISYLAFVAAQTAQYILAWQNAEKGYEEARNSAKQFAFMNAGIDEPKPRLNGETYEAYLQRESRFGQWMKDKGYESGLYTWTDNQGQENSFRVDVTSPSFPGLIPMPGVLVGLYLDGPFVPCFACFDCCKICEGELNIYKGCLASIGADILDLGFKEEVEIFDGEGCAPCSAMTSVKSFGGMIHSNPLTWILPSRATCGASVWNKAFYSVPIAFIAGIVSDNPELTVTTTRIEPNADLGLWQMQYGSISSQAKAKSSGGSVGPLPDPGYDSYLITGGY